MGYFRFLSPAFYKSAAPHLFRAHQLYSVQLLRCAPKLQSHRGSGCPGLIARAVAAGRGKSVYERLSQKVPASRNRFAVLLITPVVRLEMMSPAQSFSYGRPFGTHLWWNLRAVSYLLFIDGFPLTPSPPPHDRAGWPCMLFEHVRHPDGLRVKTAFRTFSELHLRARCSSCVAAGVVDSSVMGINNTRK